MQNASNFVVTYFSVPSIDTKYCLLLSKLISDNMPIIKVKEYAPPKSLTSHWSMSREEETNKLQKKLTKQHERDKC